MKNVFVTAIALMLAIASVGCDRASETHTKTVTDSQGNVVKQDRSSTTVDNSGNVHQSETHVDNR